MKRHRIRPGLTLLEIILTLSLAVVLMGLIAGAMRTYAREMNVRDLELHQTHLAVQLMRMIESDLMLAIHPEPIDMQPLEEFLVSAAASGIGEESSNGDAATMGTAMPEAEITDPPGAATESVLTAGLVLETPGMLGSQTSIQIDLSRLPRIEEYAPMMDPNPAVLADVPSDLKTVTYFVQPPGTTSGVADPMAEFMTESSSEHDGGGLVRRSLDRAAAIQAAMTGGLAQLNATGQLLAPEVVGLQFEYWDGTLWNPTWDSDAFGELPLAVKIQLTMRTSNDSEFASADRTFEHIVRLPMAKPMETESAILTGEPTT